MQHKILKLFEKLLKKIDNTMLAPVWGTLRFVSGELLPMCKMGTTKKTTTTKMSAITIKAEDSDDDDDGKRRRATLL